MSDEHPDKCPTCGIAREHDGPHYWRALKQAGKPMCPDPFHDPAPEHPDKCPTCGSDDPAEYASPCDRALYSDDRSDPFHRSHEGVPSRVGLHGNVVAPKPQGLDAVSGDGTWDEADERYAAAMNAPSPDKVRGILRDEVVTVDGEPHIPLEVANRRLREVEAERDQARSQLNTLREAVEEIANGEHHPPERRCAACIAKRALASRDEQDAGT